MNEEKVALVALNKKGDLTTSKLGDNLRV